MRMLVFNNYQLYQESYTHILDTAFVRFYVTVAILKKIQIVAQGKDFDIVDYYIFLGKNITFNNETGEETKKRTNLV